MKAYILLFAVLLFGCGTSDKQSVATTEPTVTSSSTTDNSLPKLNPDSLKRIEADTKKHFELVSEIFKTLNLDSLNSNDGEAYRLIVNREMPMNDVGNPISLTFLKKNGKCSVEIHEIFVGEGNSVKTKTHSTSTVSFDSISNMFGQYFWDHNITEFNCYEMFFGGKISFYESFKNGKHKLISQHNCKDKKLLPLAFYNFFIFSKYNKTVTEDFLWFKNNPPGNIKTPGPPSSLQKK